MNKKAKKVLFLTSDFPPVGGVKVFRVLKFVKYLKQLGWDPVVLTTRVSRSLYFDHSLLEEIPGGVRVYRTFYPDITNIFLYRAARYLYRKIRKREVKVKKDGPPRNLSRGIFLKISSWLLLPDSYILWLPFAVIKALSVIRKEKIDVIFTTLPVFTCGIIGYVLKKLTGLPWVLDLRDPWSREPLLVCPTRLHRFIHERLERFVLSNADRITVVSPLLKEEFRKQNNIDVSKFNVIPNGFDPEDFIKASSLNNYRRDAEFIITFTGSFEKNRNPEIFLRALSKLLEEREELTDKIRVNLIGWSSCPVDSIVDQYGLANVVRVHGFKNHAECLGFVLASDLLLVFVTGESFQKTLLTTKFYEYLFAKKFILASAPLGGVLDRTLQKTRAGMAVDPLDCEGMKDAIGMLFDKNRNNDLSVPDNSILLDSFNRKSQTRKLMEELDEIYAKHS